MNGPNDTFVDPDGARDGARQLDAAGAALARGWAEHAAIISTLNAASPWGTDDYGKEFNKNYLEGEAPAADVLEGGQVIVGRVQVLGAIALAALAGTVAVDEAVAESFGTGDA